MIDQVLVLDSRMASRQSLVQALQKSACARQVIEARSYDDGLSQLEARAIDACLLGSGLTDTVAAQFVSDGIEHSRKRGCAFIAVLREGAERPSPLLLQAGVHATMGSPFVAESFSQIVNHAIQIAHQRLRIPIANAPRLAMVSSIAMREMAVSELFGGRDKGLPASLRHTAEGMRTIASQLQTGRLSLRAGGEPSLATRDALRLVLEAAFPERPEFGSQDDKLIAAIVQWFSDRITTSHRESTERLKEALVSDAGSAPSDITGEISTNSSA